MIQNKKFLIKMDNQQGPTIQLRELCSGLWGSLDGRGVSRRQGEPSSRSPALLGPQLTASWVA